MDKKNNKYITGKNSVLDAISNKLKIKKIYATYQYQNVLEKFNIPYQIVNKNDLDKIVTTNHQGIIAEVDDYFSYCSIEEIMHNKPEVILILDHIEDINNLGSILRTANAAGVFNIIIPDKRAAQINDKVLKISSGGFVKMNICKIPSIQVAIEKLKKNNFWIYASCISENAQTYFETQYNFPLVLIVGNEAKGISSTIKKASDQLIYIPMNGTVQSLNVSIATAVLLFETVKKAHNI